MKYSKLPTEHIHEEKDNVHLLEGRHILVALFYTFLIGNMNMVDPRCASTIHTIFFYLCNHNCVFA